MARSTYDVFERYIGAGNLDEYDFDFKITALSQLLVKEYSAAGVLLQEVRGSDAVYLNGVEFDANDGGGTVTLADDLVSGRILYLILAPDAPTQDSEFRNKGDLTVRRIEDALDALAGPIQRAMYLALRSVKVPDFIDSADFDPTLPVDIVDEPSTVIGTNSDGTGLIMGPSFEEIANAEAFSEAAEAAQLAAEAAQAAAEDSADDAETAETAAEAAQAAAEAAQAAAEAAVAIALAALDSWTQHAVVDGQAATVLTGETLDSTTYRSAIYNYEIRRGAGASEIVTTGQFALQFQNSVARIQMGQDMGDLSGVVFDTSQVGTVASLRAALDVGAGNGSISLSRKRVPA